MNINPKNLLSQYPDFLIKGLLGLMNQKRSPFYVSGGTIRDWLLGRIGVDLDITVESDAFEWAHDLVRAIGGSFVALDEEQDVARVVWQGISIDFSGFREGTTSIHEDLLKRDFTINALAVSFEPGEPLIEGLQRPLDIIDPSGGIQDLEKKMIRNTSSQVFISDPLRMLRAYRFVADLGFIIDRQTADNIKNSVELISGVSAERLVYELNLIMSCDKAHAIIQVMLESEIFGKLFPELLMGVNLAQPASHHLDVFHHSLAALKYMEKIIKNPSTYFPRQAVHVSDYLVRVKRRILWLKWAALFHDLGKPLTHQIRKDKGGRITFYNHDMAGAREFSNIAAKYRWSNEDTKQVARLISMHMWPFHLNNVRRKQNLSSKACLKLIKAAGTELTGLFLLAMADSLAGQGSEKPPGMEQGMSDLYDEVLHVYLESIKPVFDSPRLLDGYDLQREFQLAPGPEFRKIFEKLDEARVEGEVCTREDALQWVKDYLQRHKEN